MTDYVDVVEHNPIVFVKAITEKLAEGYVVQNSNAGYPQFGAYGNSIRLFKGEPEGTVILSKDVTGLVEHYDPMPFVLLLESYVRNGYRFKDNGNHYFDGKGLKSIELELPVEEVKQEAPAKKAAPKKALKAEPTIKELDTKEAE
uniref:Uncharacterized protein n=2 Tax=unclassified bacterial viruses TaxID=12333 RepID=A0AAU6VZW4_9VIRU